MKTIQQWQAEDGTIFDSKEKCTDHERLCADLERLQKLLKPRPNLPDCTFENGAGYVQQTANACLAYRRGVIEQALRYTDHKFVNEDSPQKHESRAGYIISGLSAPLREAWYRVSCTDKMFREWGQPYYANNPEKAEQVRLG